VKSEGYRVKGEDGVQGGICYLIRKDDVIYEGLGFVINEGLGFRV
jgi:hypothetical protein